jgi:hypothetical protein
LYICGKRFDILIDILVATTYKASLGDGHYSDCLKHPENKIGVQTVLYAALNIIPP